MSHIAIKAGVCQATVSLALRNHFSIPLKTREKIQALAKSLGYTPHPFVSALMAERRRNKKSSLKAIITILSPYTDAIIQKNPYLHRFHSTAYEYAKTRGFILELSSTRSIHDGGESLCRILTHRGVAGLIICDYINQQESFPLTRFCWKNFSVVHYGSHSEIPPFHQLHYNVITPFRELLSQLSAHGFHRPGLMLNNSHHLLSQNHWTMAFRDWIAEMNPHREAQILLKDPSDPPSSIQRWIKRSEIDLLMTIDPPSWLDTLDHPRLINLNLPSTSTSLLGIWNNYEAVARSAINLLEGLILRNEKGIPTDPCEILSLGKIIRP